MDAIYVVHDDVQRAYDNKVLVVASSLTMFIVKFFLHCHPIGQLRHKINFKFRSSKLIMDFYFV